jgi:hypothetical protein
MKKIHVSLVSDQTIPNILAICHFCPDSLLFITTAEMEKRGKTEAILRTLKSMGMDYEGRFEKIEIQGDSFVGCREGIDQWMRGNEDYEYVVNLTCGTKIMSLTAFEYFRDYGSLMVYIPIPRNELILLFPKKTSNKPVSLDVKLSVIQYLAAYGLKVTNEGKLGGYYREAQTRKALSEWIVTHYEKVKNLLTWLASDKGGNLRKHRDDRKSFLMEGIFSGATDEEKQLFKKLGIVCVGEIISKTFDRSEIRFLTGGWLEEFCLNEVLGLSENGADDVVIGVELVNKQDRNNEFDVLFTKDNALYTIECKSLSQKDDRNADILYKIGALQKEFGLRARSFLVSTSENIMKHGKIDPAVEGRARQFNTVVIPPAEVIHLRKKLSEYLATANGALNG